MILGKRLLTRTCCFLAALATAVAVSACGSSSSSSSSSTAAGAPSGSGGASADYVKPATKPSRLVIRVWSGSEQEVYAKVAGTAFTKATGIPIKWDTTDEAVSYAKLNQEIGSGEPPSDDASFNAQQRAYTDSARGWTIPVSPTIAPNMSKVTATFAKPIGTTTTDWPYVIPYTLSVPFIVRTDKISPSEVQTWSDLFKPDLKKSLVVDSLYSSTAFGLARSIGVNPESDPPSGMAPVWKQVEKLKPNLAQLGSNADVATALTNGTVKVAISNTGTGIEAKAAGAPIKLVAPKSGMYVVGDAYYIHKGIPPAEAYYAQVFANYVLSPSVETAVAEKLGFVPVNPAASVPTYMSSDPTVFPRTTAELESEHAILAPIPLMAHNETAWQTAFENAIGG